MELKYLTFWEMDCGEPTRFSRGIDTILDKSRKNELIDDLV